MERQTESTRPLARVLLAAVALFLGAACSTSATGTESEVQSSPAPAALPVVVTLLKIEHGSCTPEFDNNNCGASGDAGDICLDAGSMANPTRASLKFVAPGQAEIQKMTIGIGASWTCPGDAGDDFPDFTNCEYAPASPGTVLQVRDDNEIARTWNYSLTVKAGPDCSPVTIHPIIENGGGNASTIADPP